MELTFIKIPVLYKARLIQFIVLPGPTDPVFARKKTKITWVLQLAICNSPFFIVVER